MQITTLLALLIVSSLITVLGAVQLVTLSVLTKIINTSSVYEFTIVDDSLTSANGQIAITFPVIKFTLNPVTCFDTDAPTTSYACPNSGNTLTVTRLASGLNFLRLSVSTVKNPGTTGIANFKYVFTATNGTIMTNLSFSYSAYLPATLSSCSVTMSPSVVNSEGQAQFTIKVRNQVPLNGSIIITFPTSWPLSAGSLAPIVSTSTQVYRKISGSEIASSQNPIVSSSLQEIQLNNLLTSLLASDRTVSFGISGILSPPTVGNTYSVIVKTLTSDGLQLIDQSPCTISLVSPQTLSLSTSSTFILGAASALTLNWTTQSAMTDNDTIVIDLPSNVQFALTSPSIVLFYGASAVTLIRSNGNTSQQKIYTISQNSPAVVIPRTSQMGFNLSNITNLINSQSRIITFTLQRNNVGIATGPLTIAVSPNSLTATLSSATTVVTKPTTLTFTLTLTNPLSATGILRITFPIQFSTTFTPTCTSSSTNILASLNSSIACSFSNRLLQVSSIFLVTVGQGSILTITVSNVINPNTISTTDPFLIYTFYDSVTITSIVDFSSSLTYTATPTTGIASISKTSNVVAAVNPLTIQYQVRSVISNNALLTIELPSEIGLSISPIFLISVNGGTAQSLVPTITGLVINFSNIISTTLTAGGTVTITITNIINPFSVKPSTNSLKIYWYSGGYNNLQESVTSGLIISVNTMNSFSNAFANFPLLKNSGSTLSTFQIQPSVPMSTGQKVSIALGSGTNVMSFPSSISCDINGNTCPCVINGLEAVFTLNVALAIGTTYSFLIDSIVLGRASAQSPPFTVTGKTIDGYGISQKVITASKNTIPSEVLSLTLNIVDNPSLLNRYQSFTLKMSFSTPLLSTDYIKINVPLTYVYPAASIQTPSICTNLNYTCNQISENQFIVRGSFGGINSVTVTVKDNLYVSPNSFNYPSAYFTVQSYDSNDNFIDATNSSQSANQASFYLTCSPKCKTCSNTNSLMCLSCYKVNDGDIIGSNFVDILLTSDNKCVSSCGSGYYNNSGICTICQSPCATCINQNACLSCVSGTYLDNNTNTCGGSCPIYTFKSGNLCANCLSPCQTCNNTATTCLTCNASTFLIGNNCVLFCGTGKFASSRICISCDVSCNNCQGQVTNCTSCATGYINNTILPGTCTNQCPTGKVNNTGVCQCAPQCLTCRGTIDTCLTCNSSGTFRLLSSTGNSCLQSCNAGTYQDSNSFRCLVCPQANCKVCNVSVCTQCDNTTFLHSGSCLLTCPEATTVVSSHCIGCISGCRSCPSQPSVCSQCYPSFLQEGSSCVLSCSTGYVRFNASICLTACPNGYVNNSDICELSNTTNNGTTNPNNPTNNTNNNTNSTTIITNKYIPFPTTIAYCVLIAVGLVSRVAFVDTIVPCSIVSLGGLLEIIMWIVVLILGIANIGGLDISSYLLIAALTCNYILNFISLFFFNKYIQADQTYQKHFEKNRCGINIFKVLSIITSHKMFMILFSCLFGARIFRGKVSVVSIFTPINILLYVSLLPSILAIVGASYACYTVQQLLLTSAVFIQSIDCIIVTILNMIFTLWVTVRSEQNYTRGFGNDKFYQTQQQINQGQKHSEDIEEALFQESGINALKSGKASNKNYYYRSQQRQKKMGSSNNDPLEQKIATRNPLSCRQSGEISSQALVMQKRNDDKNSQIKQSDSLSQSSEEISISEPLGDQQAFIANPNSKKSPIKPNVKSSSIQNTQVDAYTKKSQRGPIIDQDSEQFKNLDKDQQQKVRMQNLGTQNLGTQNLGRKRNASPQGEGSVNKIDHSFKDNSNIQRPLVNESLNEMEQIQLSPKKEVKRKSQGDPKSPNKDNKRSKSKSPGKSQSSPRKTQSKSEYKSENIKGEANEGENEGSRQNKSNLQSHTKKLSKQNKSTSKHKKDDSLHVLYSSNELSDYDQHGIDQQQDFQEQEPRLPSFYNNKRHENQKRYGTESDRLDVIQEAKNENEKRRKHTGSQQVLNTNKIRGVKYQSKDGLTIRDTRDDNQNDSIEHMRFTQNLSKGNLSNDHNLFNKAKGTEKFKGINRLFDQDFYNQDTETLKSNEGDVPYNEISPSHFNIHNQRFSEVDQTSDMPSKPELRYHINEQDADIIPDGQIFGDEDYPNIRNNRYRNSNDQPVQSQMNRHYSVQNIDYDSIFIKKVADDRIRDLQRIYLPRLEVNAARKRPKRNSKNKQ